MSQELYAYYASLLRERWGVGQCQSWTVVTPRSESFSLQEVAERLAGGREFQIVRAHVSELIDYHITDVSCEQRNGTFILYELGAATSRTDVLRRLSAGAVVHHLFWTVNSDNQFTYLKDGDLICEIDIFAPDTWPTGIVETLTELRLFDSAKSSRAAAMAMMEMRTGVHLTREWLDGIHDTVVYQHL